MADILDQCNQARRAYIGNGQWETVEQDGVYSARRSPNRLELGERQWSALAEALAEYDMMPCLTVEPPRLWGMELVKVDLPSWLMAF